MCFDCTVKIMAKFNLKICEFLVTCIDSKYAFCMSHLVSVSSGHSTIHFYDQLEVRKSREDTLTHTPFNTVYIINTYRNILCSIPAKKEVKNGMRDIQ